MSKIFDEGVIFLDLFHKRDEHFFIRSVLFEKLSVELQDAIHDDFAIIEGSLLT